MALDLKGLTQDEAFAKAADNAGVPESVMRGIWRTESSEGKNMLSPAGAKGHFGLMDNTRQTWEKREGRTFDPNDFSDALTVASLQMQENMKSTGNLNDALRMYNAGTDRARWDNPETRAYVGKVTGVASDGNDSGFEVRNVNPIGGDPEPLTREQVWNTSAYDLRQQKNQHTDGSASKEYLSDVEKGVIQQAGVESAVGAVMSGQDPVQAAMQAREANPAQLTEAFVNSEHNQQRDDYTADKLWEESQARMKLAEEEQAKVDALGFTDKFAAAYNKSTITGAVWHMLREDDQFSTHAEPGFNLLDKATIDDVYKYAQDEREVDWQLRARSNSELQHIRKQIEWDREQTKTLSSGTGAWGQAGYSLLAGVLDPVGWAAGLGVGKGFQMAGIGARAAFQAGNAAKGLSYLTLEGAAGNVLATATLDAAGQYQTTSDYAFAAMTGGAMSSMTHGLGWIAKGSNRQMIRQQMVDFFNTGKAAAVSSDARLYAEASAALGPNATPADINAEVARRVTEAEQRTMEAVLGAAPEIEQVLPKMDSNAWAAARAQMQPGATQLPKNMPGALVTSAADRARIIKQFGLESIADGAERNLAAEMYGRAERFLNSNQIDGERLNTLLKKAGLEATSTTLLSSKNPLLKMFAAVALESPTGAAGRRVTAAITAKARERIYIDNALLEYENAYAAYRAARGRTPLGDYADSGAMRRQFDKEVYAARERRNQGYQGPERDPSIYRASDVLDAAYKRMGDDQVHVGTLGFEHIKASDSRGYSPRRWASGLIRAMNPSQRENLRGYLAAEFQTTAGYDAKFAKRFATEYMERIERRATGGYDIPANLHDTDAADIIRDALKAMGASQMEMDKVMGRFSRGGAQHTKSRIDMDLTREFTNPDGTKASMLDYIDTDNVSLLRNYARRVAGETALAKYGIMGEPGLKELRAAVEIANAGHGRVSDAELRAFDQVAAEFLGKPFGLHLGKVADNAAVLASATKLGGMGWTQMGEYGNGIAGVGFMHVMKAISAAPAMYKKIRVLVKGGKVHDLVHEVEQFTGELGIDGYKMTGLYDVHNGHEVYGRETLGVVSRAIRQGGNAMRMLSFHRAIHATQTRGMAEQIIAKSIHYIRTGKDNAALADMGIHPQLAADIKKELGRIAKFDSRGKLIDLDLQKAKNLTAVNEWAQAVHRGSAQIIQDTFTGETGKWATNGLLKLLTQFRTFGIISVEKQFGRQMAVHGTAKALGYMLGSMSFAVPLIYARVGLKAVGMSEEKREDYFERNLSPFAIGRATINYASALGLAPDILDFGSEITGLGSSTGGRSGSKGLIGGLLVPAVGNANDVFQSLTQHDPHKMVRALPGSSLPYLSWAVNGLDSSD